ncbi:agmatine deiminase family protein [Flavobacterium sp.]|uniref:agmatine deiminase family protein n=1 Tax=Flavobacterium sp. TaxID=239 RepID=UPI00122A1158|nr:agmatine deiminase family protein [Flavobacterium sp.]RZJ70135.1 MAG: T9SS type A sorting domain-containing protein [Flavobacterium sp.]
MKNNYFGFIVVAFLSTASLSAQQNPLPHNLTESEKQQLPNLSFRRTALSAPPTTAVRAAAEWEEVEYLVLTWVPAYQNILRQIVAVGVNECKVVITTQNQDAVSAYLTNNGISLTNVIFLNAPSDSIWIRDYAGNTVYSNDVGDRALTDWIYNRPRPNDDAMPSAQANLFNIPIYVTDTGTNDLVNTGGNYMSDGLGNAFASELILDENDAGNPYNVSVKDESQIDAIMQAYMGISNFIKMPTLPYDEIHHIDMHMKLLDEETLLVSHYPQGIADGPQIEANIAQVLATQQSAFGSPYKVHWIDAPPSTTGSFPDTGGYYRTFTNAVFVNGSVIIPNYRAAVDAPAIAQYQQLLPGYNIVGIDVDNANENLIASLGAIHCITHTIGVQNPLWIVHQPVSDAVADEMVPITATIRHSSGISGAIVFWRPQGSSNWTQTTMNPIASENWTANIPMPADGTDVEYYIHASANSGKQISRPIVAPDGFWTIQTQALSAGEWAISHISQPYPNPAKDKVAVNLDRIYGKIKISVCNTLGQKLYETNVEGGSGTISLDLLPTWKGTLFLTFEGAFGKVTRKVLKF